MLLATVPRCGNKLGYLLLERHRSIASRPPTTAGVAPERAEVVTMEASRWVQLEEAGWWCDGRQSSIITDDAGSMCRLRGGEVGQIGRWLHRLRQ